MLVLILVIIMMGLGAVYTMPVWGSESGQVGQLQLNPQAPSEAAGSNSTPYRLTLVETAANEWNSTAPGSQPMFLVVGPTGLESSANISVPARTLIELVIISYDSPTPPPAQYSSVTGTVGDGMYVINGTSASMGVGELWGAEVSSVPTDQIAHTFTIASLGINIPVVGGDTEIAFLYLNQTGTFTWQCYTPCGFPMNAGWSGAMVTPGWMTGLVTVYQAPSTTPSTTSTSVTATAAPTGITPTLAAAVGIGLLIVGLIVGMIVSFRRPKLREEKK